MKRELIEQFKQQWEGDQTPPDIVLFVAEHSLKNAEDVVQLVLLDQVFRWPTAAPLKVEEYLELFPSLNDSHTKRLIIAGEMKVCQGLGIEPRPDLQTRFPDFCEVTAVDHFGTATIESLAEKLADSLGSIPRELGDSTQAASSSPACSAVGQGGRYKLQWLLGAGGFGQVWVGVDEELRRRVAIKMPHAKRTQYPQFAEMFVSEARALANLDHPNVVPIYDAGLDPQSGLVFMVSKLIEGETLTHLLRSCRVAPDRSAQLIQKIANALQHAHDRQIIHRDIKSSNILIEDRSQEPYLSDFGLALRDGNLAKSFRMSGTPAYMSPEQARGEGHRIDGRSDIFSLGVVFYQLLTGQRPFRGATVNEILHAVINQQPVRPSEIDPKVPAELERICLKALAKRSSDRYETAALLAADLADWSHLPTIQQHVPMVPRGIRSFDTEDADFFLELVPGPRHRSGLPECIFFWKTRIEQTDPDKTFSVALLYGPSGSGKSSLVKAGLLSHLPKDLRVIYVEATAEETETRIQKALEKELSTLSGVTGLANMLSTLRQSSGPKTIIIIDQFEQWLQANESSLESELVRAMRQCDGGRVQALVMVRDDFSMAATRFMRALDQKIVEGDNFAIIDIFDKDHATDVFVRFGQAFGKLPRNADEMSPGQWEFVQASIAGLAMDGKVMPVRLALFADMVKDKSWTPGTLDEVGGTQGIGVNFLERAFNSREANPVHRQHEQGARGVLKALLPEVGNNIKGNMRSHLELQNSAGYTAKPREFQELLRILDGELRLITPTDPEGQSSSSASDFGSQYFQLTHDYLVAPLRIWLFSKQRETRQGRAELRLSERAEQWNQKPENRNLLGLLEWLAILIFSSRKRWTEKERAVFDASTSRYRRLAVWSFMLLIAVLGSTAAYLQRVQRSLAQQQVAALIQQLKTGEVSFLASVVAELDRMPEDDLQELIEQKPDFPPAARWRASLELVRLNRQEAESLQSKLLDSSTGGQEFVLICDRLKALNLASPEWASQRLNESASHQFRAACALASWDPQHELLSQKSDVIDEYLLDLPTLSARQWCRILYPARESLIQDLLRKFPATSNSSRAHNCALAISIFQDGNTEALVALLPEATNAQARALLDVLQVDSEAQSLRAIHQLLKKRIASSGGTTEESQDRHARAIAMLSIAAMLLGDLAPWTDCMKFRPDPRLESYATILLRQLDISSSVLINLLVSRSVDSNSQRALLLALEPQLAELSQSHRDFLLEHCQMLYQLGKEAELHSTAELVLSRAGEGNLPSLEKLTVPAGATWSLAINGHTLCHLEVDGQRIGIASKETTIEQYAAFKKSHIQKFADSRNGPVANLFINECIRYCQWLSEQSLPSDQWCYPPLAELAKMNGKNVFLPVENFRSRIGFRLPILQEWDAASQAQAQSPRFYGNDRELLSFFATDVLRSNGMPSEVGRLMPNRLGLFDTYGNVSELTTSDDGRKFWACGSTCRSQPEASVAGVHFPVTSHINDGDPLLGFRIARSLPY